MKNIINDVIKIFETNLTNHSYSRIIQRLEIMKKNNDITNNEFNKIKNNLSSMLNYNFNPNKSYGLKLGEFNINPESSLITDKHKSGIYYTINSLDSNDIIKDYTGNELWGIVRNNKLITVFLRKTIQRKSAENDRMNGGLGVNEIIDNLPNYILAQKYKQF